MIEAPARRLDEAPLDGDVARAELIDWRERGITAGITCRGAGFNLGLATPESAAEVTGRWRRFARSMQPAFPTVVMALQAHGCQIGVYDAAPTGWLIGESLDGHVTRCAGILLAVTVADCVPVYLLHPPTGTLGLLHAGWRGTAAGIVERGLDQASAVAKAPVSEFLIHCGVGICGKCYEVGPEVIREVTGRTVPVAGRLDLRAEVVARARRHGAERISVSGWCAAHDGDRFFSHRRSGGTDGRMAAYLGRARRGGPAVNGGTGTG